MENKWFVVLEMSNGTEEEFVVNAKDGTEAEEKLQAYLDLQFHFTKWTGYKIYNLSDLIEIK